MALTLKDADAFRELATLIDEEIDLYSDEDLPMLASASMIIFVRSLISGSIKLLPL